MLWQQTFGARSIQHGVKIDSVDEIRFPEKQVYSIHQEVKTFGQLNRTTKIQLIQFEHQPKFVIGPNVREKMR